MTDADNKDTQDRHHTSGIDMGNARPTIERTGTTQRGGDMGNAGPIIERTGTTKRGNDMGNAGPVVERNGSRVQGHEVDGTTENNDLVDGRLNPDAQSSGDETGKPFNPKENDMA
ncbi:hypothetical protein [Methylobacterium indicum]|uniref:hypothetical protein n=1 Tax=Methylobacterium indicum TaxID=1775910 RepID=UPI000B04E0E8|nr:hypothetical protein [Methylobacterium indicum]